MYFSLFAVFTLLAATLTTAAPAPDSSKWTRWTNSQRLARGLPLLPPKFGRNLPGNIQAREPTHAYAARRGAPSATPSSVPPIKQYTGTIGVRSTQNLSFYGDVNDWASGITGVNWSGNSTEDLHVKVVGSGPYYDLLATNPNFPAPYYVGAAANKTTTLKAGSAATVDLAHVNQTAPGSPPTSGGESAIWTFNPNTGALTPNFVNPDGSKPTTYIGFDIKYNKLFFLGDIDAYNAAHSYSPAQLVTVWLQQ